MQNQASVISMMKSMIPITRFNRGEASKIFDEVEASGSKVVIKNNKPACVLIAPDKYEALLEIIADYQLLLEAQSRMANYNAGESKSHDDLIRELGITDADLENVDVEIE